MNAEPLLSEAVTVSSKYQIVSPRRVRKYLDLKPGQKLRLVLYDGQVRLISVPSLKEARGSLKGLDTDAQREEEEREC
jgi:AbrB family looped-hinge helix DNA binding protein